MGPQIKMLSISSFLIFDADHGSSDGTRTGPATVAGENFFNVEMVVPLLIWTWRLYSWELVICTSQMEMYLAHVESYLHPACPA